MNKSDRLVFIGLVGGVLCMLLWMASASMRPSVGNGTAIAPGLPAPEIKAAGWLNGEPPSAESLRGKVVVIDVWAYNCSPCLAAAPELIDVYHRYHDRGVVFIGLTPMGEESLDQSRKFIERAKIPWVNGYGAIETLLALGSEGFPEVWVFGRDGRIAWNTYQEGRESLDAALERALAASAEVENTDQENSAAVSN